MTKQSTNPTVGGRINKLREAHGMSQRELSRLLTESGSKVSHTAIGAWEAGRSMPRHVHIAAMATIFAVDPGLLLFGKIHPASREKEIAARLALLPADAQDRIEELVDSMLKLSVNPVDPGQEESNGTGNGQPKQARGRAKS